MQNAVDMMAMVQKSSMLRQKLEIPSRPAGNDKTSFKKELFEAKQDYTRSNNEKPKVNEAQAQRTAEKKLDKLVKTMSGNPLKPEVKEKLDEASDAKTMELDEKISTESKTVEELDKVEEGAASEETIGSVLEMLQQLMQIMKGFKLENTEKLNLDELKNQLQMGIGQINELLSAIPEGQTSELSKLMTDLKTDMAGLLKQLEITPEYKVDKDLLREQMDLLAKKLEQAAAKLMPSNDEQSVNQNDNGFAKQEAQNVSRLGGKQDINTDAKTAEEKAVEINQPAPTEKNKEAKSDHENSNQGEEKTAYKTDMKQESSQAIASEKPNAEVSKDAIAAPVEKPNFQINQKQISHNLQKESLVKINSTDIINQVVKKADIIIQGGHQEMIMKLEPESLGKLNLKLVLENGIVTAKFIAESQQVKEVIESSFNQLKDALQEKGIAVQGFSVSVGQQGAEFNSGQGFDQWKKSIKVSNKINGEYLMLEDEMDSNSNPYSYHDGKVDYRA